ncbi:flagellar hook protein FlgK [Bacillus coahuilensis m2-6]|uniref:flagellar hook-associated protein FlgK n=1 Tax=Bacillus coahuilensis TaxID=408580 RepID=UPI000750574C|nr:flagellar hook-associated protein FlgK [Bacillus coahuilensis]KUP05710.1 flagellar hook protein FlgK [Bacillus coahuilensis m2-6]
MSTFAGLETAKRAMNTSQSALYTTSHNIANANTPGYSRQQVSMSTTTPFPTAGFNAPQIPGQIGTGVEANAIIRIRDSFLDDQYRGEHNKLGYYQSQATALEKMEEIMNEPSDSGLAATMDMFWKSLQDLAADPTNDGAKSVVRQRGIAVAETFNYLSTSIKNVQKDLQNEISVTEKQVNSLLNQINNLNQQIADVEPHGYVPNDLYDRRDNLLDELSGLVDISVSYQKNGGQPHPNAVGTAVVYLSNGENSTRSAMLVGKNTVNEIKVNYNTDDLVSSVTVGAQTVSMEDFESVGKLRGLVESYGYETSSNPVNGTYANMLEELDYMAFTFANEFNAVHSSGATAAMINGAPGPAPDFFAGEYGAAIATQKDFASKIGISNDIYQNLDNMATASTADLSMGNAENVTKLANVITTAPAFGAYNTTFKNYYESIIGDMAVQAQEANRLTTNSDTLRVAVENRRMSTSQVSLDEEMTNMVQYQHAYNAAARMISLTDELLDTIINGMGRAGR